MSQNKYSTVMNLLYERLHHSSTAGSWRSLQLARKEEEEATPVVRSIQCQPCFVLLGQHAFLFDEFLRIGTDCTIMKVLWLNNTITKATTRFAFQLYATKMSSSAPPASSPDPYKSSSFIGHSLWMMPSGASKDAYSKIVGSMSSELNTFEFLPHITLVAAMMKGEEDAVERTKALAEKLAPYSFEFEEISYRDAYFQCVYAKMKRTDSVVQANALARQFFPERQSDAEYMPHLSLIYGDFDEKTKTESIIPKITTMMQEEETAKATMIIPVDAIEVWSTQGDVKEWYRVATIPLLGKPENGDMN